MDYSSMVGGGVVVVALGAFSLVKYVIGQRRNGKTTNCGNGMCTWTKDQVTGMVASTDKINETSAAALKEQRHFNAMFREWLAEEKGRREAMRNTGEHRVG